jgi:hypothetical protein
MTTFKNAVVEWTDTINEWYHLGASEEEVASAFSNLKEYRDAQDKLGDIPYVEAFFHGPGKMLGGGPIWCTMLDTVDREMLAGLVEHNRKQ